MFIIWGSRVRQTPRGVVAHRCTTCRAIVIFSVIDIYKVSHIYFISDGGRLQSSVMKCLGCGAERTFPSQLFASVVSAQAVMSLQDVLRETNPRLFEQMKSPVPITAGDDGRAGALLQQLEMAAEQDGTSNMLRLRLLTWHTLSEDARSTLQSEVEAYIGGLNHERRAAHLLGLMMSARPSNKGLIAFWLFAVGLPCLAYLLMGLIGDIGLPIWLGTMIGGYFAGRQAAADLDDKWYREWLRREVLPGTASGQVSVSVLCALMHEAQTVSKSPVLGYTDTIEQLAREAGRWTDDALPRSRATVRVPVLPEDRLPGCGPVLFMNIAAIILGGLCFLMAQSLLPRRTVASSPSTPPPVAAVPSPASASTSAPPRHPSSSPRADAFRLRDGRIAPPEFLPKPDGPPGVEKIWISSDFDGIPRGLKSIFRSGDPIRITILHVDLKANQQVVLHFHRDQTSSRFDTRHTLTRTTGTGLAGETLDQGLEPGRYLVRVLVDSVPQVDTRFVVLP